MLLRSRVVRRAAHGTRIENIAILDFEMDLLTTLMIEKLSNAENNKTITAISQPLLRRTV
jgi:hypothetical protein